LLQPISKFIFAKISERIFFHGESRTKEQEYRKTTLFSYRHTTVLFLFVLNVNDFIVTP